MVTMRPEVKRKSNIFFYYWLPPIMWAVLIFALSSHQTGTASVIVWTDFAIKKSAHVFVYGILTAMLYRAFCVSGVDRMNAGLAAIFISCLYGMSDEYHQSFVPGRTGKVRDVGFDTIGSILSIWVTWNILPRAPMKLRKLAKGLELI